MNREHRFSGAERAVGQSAGLQRQTPSSADAEWMEADGVSIPEPPPEHPRLFLRRRDLDDLRRRVEHPVLKPVWEDLQAQAKENMENRMQIDALRYLLNPDPEFGRSTVAAALDTLQEAVFPRRKGITRPIGRMMVAGAVVYPS